LLQYLSQAFIHYNVSLNENLSVPNRCHEFPNRLYGGPEHAGGVSSLQAAGSGNRTAKAVIGTEGGGLARRAGHGDGEQNWLIDGYSETGLRHGQTDRTRSEGG
jgi:hypothetical protein